MKKAKNIIFSTLFLVNCGEMAEEVKINDIPSNNVYIKKDCNVDLYNNCYEIFDYRNIETYNQDGWKLENNSIISIAKLEEIKNGNEVVVFNVKFNRVGKYYFYFNANVTDVNHAGKQDSMYSPLDFNILPKLVIDGWEGDYVDKNGNIYMTGIPTWFKTDLLYIVDNLEDNLTFKIGVRQGGLSLNQIMFSENIDVLEIFKRLSDNNFK